NRLPGGSPHYTGAQVWGRISEEKQIIFQQRITDAMRSIDPYAAVLGVRMSLITFAFSYTVHGEQGSDRAEFLKRLQESVLPIEVMCSVLCVVAIVLFVWNPVNGGGAGHGAAEIVWRKKIDFLEQLSDVLVEVCW
ncbi:hypothetical protein GIB67_000388, partial [Kingdonia uniflora]